MKLYQLHLPSSRRETSLKDDHYAHMKALGFTDEEIATDWDEVAKELDSLITAETDPHLLAR